MNSQQSASPKTPKKSNSLRNVLSLVVPKSSPHDSKGGIESPKKDEGSIQPSNIIPFSAEEITGMKKILDDQTRRPSIGHGATAIIHVQHCFDQCWRFAHLTTLGHEFRAVQFGLNFGRAQEILGSFGGATCWWKIIEPPLVAKDYARVIELLKEYIRLLGLSNPPEAVISKP
jgi:hypothetical protein